MNDTETKPAPMTDEELVAILNSLPKQPKRKPPNGLRLSLDPNACRKAITFVAGVIPNRTTLPVLSMMHLAGNGSTILRGTDLDVTLSSELDVKAKIDGECLLPKAALLGALKASKKRLEIAMGEKLMADVVADGFKQTVPTLSVDEYPPGLEVKPEITLQVSATQLRQALKQIEMAQSTDESRYVLNGVFFHVNPHDLTMVATDGRRLHRTHIVRSDAAQEGQIMDAGDGPAEQPKQAPDAPGFIVPSRGIDHILRLPVERSTDILFIEAETKDRNYATLRYGSHTITTKLVEGNYPNYRQVIPSEFKEVVRLEADAFATAVRNISTVVTEKSNSVKLKLKRNRMELTASSPELGDAKAELATNYRGADMSIAFNPEYVLDIAAASKGAECDLKLVDELSPGVFTGGNLLCVVMPMRLS